MGHKKTRSGQICSFHVALCESLRCRSVLPRSFGWFALMFCPPSLFLWRLVTKLLEDLTSVDVQGKHRRHTDERLLQHKASVSTRSRTASSAQPACLHLQSLTLLKLSKAYASVSLSQKQRLAILHQQQTHSSRHQLQSGERTRPHQVTHLQPSPRCSLMNTCTAYL